MRKYASVAPDWQRLGDAVFRRRVDLGITSRRALAERAGVGKRTVDSLETGVGVGATSIYKIERALELEPGSLNAVLQGDQPPALTEVDRSPPDESAASTSDQAELLLEELDRMRARLLAARERDKIDDVTWAALVRDAETVLDRARAVRKKD